MRRFMALALVLAAQTLAAAQLPADAQVRPASARGAEISPNDAQVVTLQAISAYFKDTAHLKGVFAQTNPDGKKMRGRFALKQPGKFRFDYGYGSKLVITSNGSMLAVQDSDIASDTRYDVDRTPFRILLRKDVDLLRDARIFEVEDTGEHVAIAIGDKSPDAPGRIRLVFAKTPQLELKEWVTTDAQGTVTRVEISALSRPEALDEAQFKIRGVSRQ
jgi:outer membrane lipoprotein-sorting protein